MAQRDFSRPIRTAGTSAPPEGVHEEIVCWTVVTGRGKAFVRHMRDERSEAFAKDLVDSRDAIGKIRELLAEFDDAEWPTHRDRRRARTDLVRAIRQVVKRPTA